MKVTYPVKREIDVPDVDDEEIRELLADDPSEVIENPQSVCMVSAEILKEDGSDERHVIELLNVDGAPVTFKAHADSMIDFMQRSNDEDEESKAAAQ